MRHPYEIILTWYVLQWSEFSSLSTYLGKYKYMDIYYKTSPLDFIYIFNWKRNIKLNKDHKPLVCFI